MKSTLRHMLVAAAASVALVGGALIAPATADAAPPVSAEALAAKRALDAITPSPTQAAGAIDGIEAANALLDQLGITPFTPTIGACTDFTFPSAIGGAIPGPYTPLFKDLTILGVDLNAVRAGEILYGFVPVGTFDDSGDKSGMQVAWLNVNTFQGGLGAPMGGLTDVLVDAVAARAGISASNPLLNEFKSKLNVIPSNGVRGGIVETGQGTVLSAIYGSIKKGDATCYFFPSLGIATVA
ncbi:hypothetical protein GYA93_07060 [Gordonia desulfuricans]|uniref:Secreted protein n=1 Tax=Gordonia desulfuricans TaxID=89051 RepID=A0A7K3LMQ8_9ACTN|nr:hypothetical protein [Gordonia desulfuricans]NDK89341.1 hypothetical protein [Gordonia desulfuricans]